jgi:hypothetical protein
VTGRDLLHQDIRSQGVPHEAASPLEQLNAVLVTAAQIERAWTGPGDDAATGMTPQQAEAVRARATALSAWIAAHDPQVQSNREALLSAAAHFSLSEGQDGYGFEPSGFQEMILFIEELPW